jgi:hypothetical protein
MWALVALSFGALKAGAQTQAEVDSIKKFSAEFLRDKMATDRELKVDTLWVNDTSEVTDWGDFGVYYPGQCSDGSCKLPQVVVKYLASKVQDQELQNRIALANGIVPGSYSHEGGKYGHRGRLDEMYGEICPGWSVSDFAQRKIVNELAARLAENFDMREKILSGQLSKNLLRHIANNMPKYKQYNKEYFLWLTENKITQKMSNAEAKIMLKSIVKWMKTSEGRGKYYRIAAFSAGLWAGKNINVLIEDNWDQEDMVDMDAFMTRSFTVGENSVLELAGSDAVDELMNALAGALRSQKSTIAQQEGIVDRGWSGASKKVAEKYKKFVERDSKSKLRATKYMDATNKQAKEK